MFGARLDDSQLKPPRQKRNVPLHHLSERCRCRVISLKVLRRKSLEVEERGGLLTRGDDPAALAERGACRLRLGGEEEAS